MSMIMERDEPFKRYTAREIESALRDEGLDRDDMTILSAVFGQVYVYPSKINPEEMTIAGHPAADVAVYEVDDHRTGIFNVFGKKPVILINSDDAVMDYTVISDMHPVSDAEFYIWSTDPFGESGEDLGYWHRDDSIIPDYMPRFEGVLNWPDLPADTDNDEEE